MDHTSEDAAVTTTAGEVAIPAEQLMPPSPEFERMFRPGTRYAYEDGEVLVTEAQPAGTLRMPSGRLVVTDPSMLDASPQPYVRSVPPGSYPLTLALVRSAGHPAFVRPAAARIDICGEPVVSWRMAVVSGQPEPDADAGSPEGQDYIGTGVDAGMLALHDAAAAAGLVEFLGEDWAAAWDAWEALCKRVDADHFAEIVDPESGANLIVFSSGGDGSYPTWIGHAADGRVACFLVETFELRDATFVGASALTDLSGGTHAGPA